MATAGLTRLLVAIAVLGACGDGGQAGDETSEDTGSNTGSVFDQLPGDEVYANLCEFCHGTDALGTAFGPELRHPPEDYAMHVVRNGLPGVQFPSSAMAPFAEEIIGDETLRRVIDHLRAYPQPTTGEALYLDYCANCHGADGQRGAIDNAVVGLSEDVIALQVRTGAGANTYEPRALYMPAYTTDELTDTQLTAIANYILAL